MPAIIRLSRHGKKGQAFYHIVVADSRYARDARFIEKIGTYNPRTNPVTVTIKFDRAIDWLRKGAKPSDTTRSILSSQGVMFMAHLQKGVTKGALTQEQADAKFAKWLSEKEVQIGNTKSSTESSKKEAYKKRMAVELTSRESRSAKRKAKTIQTNPPPDGVPVPVAESSSAPVKSPNSELPTTPEVSAPEAPPEAPATEPQA